MKPFNLKEFNVHGTEFSVVRLRFSHDDGLTRKVEGRKVWELPGESLELANGSLAAPAPGCDFIASGHSMSSTGFYELHKCIQIISVGAPGDVAGFVYVLDENIEEVMPEITELFLRLAIEHFDEQVDTATTAADSAEALLQLVLQGE